MSGSTQWRAMRWISWSAAIGSLMLLAAGPLVGEDGAAPDLPESNSAETAADTPFPSGVAAGDAAPTTDEQQAQMQELIRQAEQARERQQAELRKAMDTAQWRASHREKSVIKVDGGTLNTFCLNIDGNLLAGCGGSKADYVADPDSPTGYRTQRTASDAEIRVYTPEGSLLKTWQVDVKPEAIAVARDGTIFVGGDGRMTRLDQTGKVLAEADSPVVAAYAQEQQQEAAEPNAREEADKTDDTEAAHTKLNTSVFRAVVEIMLGSTQPDEAEVAAIEEAGMQQRIRGVNGLAVTEQDVFVVCPMRTGYGFSIWRTDHDFQNGVEIVSKLRGCCGQMDISAYGGDVFVCENSRKRVIQYDREGKLVSQFGKSSRSEPDGFGSCCNPMNLAFSSNGDVITSESGPPDAVKRFTRDGEFVSVLALPQFAGGCLRVTVAISPDDRQLYVLNTGANAIHVFADRRYEPTHSQVAEIPLKTKDQPAALHTFCTTGDGKLLAACGGKRVNYIRSEEGVKVETIDEPAEIRVLSPEGKQLDLWPLEFKPEAVNVAPDGTVFVAGEGHVAKLSPAGKILLTADSPTRPQVQQLLDKADETAAERQQQAQQQAAKYKELAEKSAADLKAGTRDGKELTEAEKQRLQQEVKRAERMAGMMQQQAGQAKQMAVLSANSKLRTTGIAATKQDVFLCCAAVEGYGYDIYRLDHNLTGAVKIVAGLRGCCGQMDIQALDGDVYAAENSRGRVVRFDRDGEEVASWGKRDRKSVEGFGSCCNPMNVRLMPDGTVYTSEASLGRIKRFSQDGEFLGLVGTADIVPGCKHVAVGMSPDGRTVYLLDITRSQITVLEQQVEPEDSAVAEQEEEINNSIPGIIGGIF